ncbi:MAG: hypothetical protein EOM20_01525 [Spartobacteria bacterium]|nr:hypothetical protein [Spartobacteria bacterium]
MKAGIGFSTHKDSQKAAEEAVRAALEVSGEPGLTFLFTTDGYDQKQVYDTVKSRIGASRLVGMCCAGVICAKGVLQDGLGVCTLSSPGMRVATALCEGLSSDSAGVGRIVAATLHKSGIEKGTVFIFPDGFGGDISVMLRELYNGLGPEYRYIGGGAGDNLKFYKAFQFTDEKMTSDALAVALVDGLVISTGLGHGWQPIGDPLVITAVREKCVVEIDGSPAFDAYSERLGGVNRNDFAIVGMKHPLGFPDIAGHYLIRDPIGLADDNALNFISEIPRHGVGNIMEGHLDELIDTAAEITREAVAPLKKPVVALLFDCISRFLLMQGDFNRELAAIQEELGEGVPMLGALTFGEVGSYVDVPMLHNKTTTIAVLDEVAKE